jgi:hypothetical protein
MEMIEMNAHAYLISDLLDWRSFRLKRRFLDGRLRRILRGPW